MAVSPGPRTELEPRREHPHRALLGYLALALVLVVVAYDVQQNRGEINQLHSLANAQRAFRVSRAALTTRTDAKLCAAENSTRGVALRRENRDYRNLDRNLRLLGIPKTRAIVRVARHDHRIAVAELKPLKCKRLPTATAGANPKP